MSARGIRVGFVTNKLTLRGAEVSLYDYADSNETILGNTSLVLVRPYELVTKADPQDVHEAAYEKFAKRFGQNLLFYELPGDIPALVASHGITALFIEKAGAPWDGLVYDCCPTIIHAIFTTEHPHGTAYCPISPFLNTRFNTSYPVLPNIVKIHPSQANLRQELGISPTALVFASYGGQQEFDIYYVKRAICEFIKTPRAQEGDYHFIMMNHVVFGQRHPRLHFLPGTADMERKRQFINTADAMIYGRKEGETFGLAIAEFALAGKPILASRQANARFHLDTLGERIILHSAAEDLLAILAEWPQALNRNPLAREPGTPYLVFSPEAVMAKFRNVLESVVSSSDSAAGCAAGCAAAAAAAKAAATTTSANSARFSSPH